jgi:predicted DsbA family dithiol-disulfide isomerase
LFLIITLKAQQTKQIKTGMNDLKMKESKFKVEVWSDVICPFCYIGKRHFEAALKQFADSSKVELVWKSFQLDPNMPDDNKGMSAYQYLANRKGISLEQSVSMHRNVIAMAKECGLFYNYDKAVVANSFNAHRLLQYAKTKGKGDAVKEKLFEAYFIEGKNISDKAVLVSIALLCALTEEEVKSVLDSTHYTEEVKRDINEASTLGVSGVPFFVFNRKYAVSGAQPAEVFLQTLQKTFADWKANNPEQQLEVSSGNSCTPDKTCDAEDKK